MGTGLLVAAASAGSIATVVGLAALLVGVMVFVCIADSRGPGVAEDPRPRPLSERERAGEDR